MELGAIGELVGGVAVVVSLVYLAIQVRHNTAYVAYSSQVAQMPALSNIDATLKDVRLVIADSPDLADLVIRWLKEYRLLERPEQFRVHVVLEIFVDLMQEFFRRGQEGLIEAEVFEERKGYLDEFLVEPGFRDWWCDRSRFYIPEFREFLGSRITDVRTEPQRSPDL